MVMGEIGKEFTLAIIGGGPAGYMAAIRAGQLGLDTVLIEEKEIGGECLNRGCIPSKMLLNVSRIAKEAKSLEKVGMNIRIGRADMARLRKENLTIIKKLRDGIRFLLRAYGVNVISGKARFESSRYLLVETKDGRESIRFRNALITSGSLPYIPDGIKIGKSIITSREALFLDKMPRKVAIIGAGYIAAELGTFFSEMGCETHLLARSRLLSRFEEDLVGEVIARKNERMKIYEKCVVSAVRHNKTNAVVEFAYGGEGKLQRLSVDKVIIAIGRVPNTKDLELENTSVKVDKDGFIEVNEKMQTTDPGIYAAGDCTRGQMLAHKAFAQGVVVAEAIAGIKSAAFDVRAIPETVFTSPEIAVVGLSLEEAVQKGYNAREAKLPFSAIGRAVASENGEGFVKMIYDADGRILGFRMVGKNVSELLGEAGLAIETNAYLDDIVGTVHAHPTFYEAIREAAGLGLGKPMHYLLRKK